jgi:uncharacterized protein YcbX
MTATVKQIYRYPFKSMKPESLNRVALTPHNPIPLDRIFAFAHGTTEFDPTQPQHLSKDHFLVLKNNPKLAILDSVYHPDTQLFQLKIAGVMQAEGHLNQVAGRACIEDFLRQHLGSEVKGKGFIVHADQHMFSDVDARVLSFINLASVRALEAKIGTTLDPLRFRANVYFDDLEPWAELDWAHNIGVGEVQFSVLKPTVRCAATNVNPSSAVLDLQVPKALHQAYGHRYLGMYMRVETVGEIAVGDVFK